MNKKPLLLLGGLTLLAAVIAVVMGADDATEPPDLGAALFPALMDRINDLAELRIETDDDTLHLRLDGGTWRVDELGGYAAKFEEVKQAALAVATLRPLEPKTANPARWPRLGVQGPDAEVDEFAEDVAPSTRVTLVDRNGSTLAALLVGKTRPGRPPALYVRRDGEETSWLAAGELRLPAGPVGWVDEVITDIRAERLGRVVIEHDDGDRVAAYRAEESSGDWLLAGVPEGHEPNYPTVASTLTHGLSRLTFEDVLPASEVTWPETGVTRTVYMGFDGLVVTLVSAEIDGRRHLRVEAGASDDELAAVPIDALPTPAVLGSPWPGDDTDADDSDDADAGAGGDADADSADFVVDDEPDGADAAGDGPTPGTTGEESAAQRRAALHEEMAALAAATEPWVFVIPDWKAKPLVERMEALVRPVEDAAAAPDAGEPPAASDADGG